MILGRWTLDPSSIYVAMDLMSRSIVVVADAGHEEVLALASARFSVDLAIHLSTLAAVHAGGCELLCSESGRTEAQANNDRNANPKRSVFNSS